MQSHLLMYNLCNRVYKLHDALLQCSSGDFASQISCRWCHCGCRCKQRCQSPLGLQVLARDGHGCGCGWGCRCKPSVKSDSGHASGTIACSQAYESKQDLQHALQLQQSNSSMRGVGRVLWNFHRQSCDQYLAAYSFTYLHLSKVSQEGSLLAKAGTLTAHLQDFCSVREISDITEAKNGMHALPWNHGLNGTTTSHVLRYHLHIHFVISWQWDIIPCGKVSPLLDSQIFLGCSARTTRRRDEKAAALPFCQYSHADGILQTRGHQCCF